MSALTSRENVLPPDPPREAHGWHKRGFTSGGSFHSDLHLWYWGGPEASFFQRRLKQDISSVCLDRTLRCLGLRSHELVLEGL